MNPPVMPGSSSERSTMPRHNEGNDQEEMRESSTEDVSQRGIETVAVHDERSSGNVGNVTTVVEAMPSPPMRSALFDQSSSIYDSPRRVSVPSGSSHPIFDTQSEGSFEFHTTHTAVIARRPEQSPRLSVSSSNSSRSPQLLEKSENDPKNDGDSLVRPLTSYREPERHTPTVRETSGEPSSVLPERVDFPEPQVHLPEEPSVPMRSIENTTGNSSDTPLPPPDRRIVDRDPQRLSASSKRLSKGTMAETPLLVAAERSPQITHNGSPPKDSRLALLNTESGYISPYSSESLGSSNYGTAEILTQVRTPPNNPATQGSKRVAINPFDVLYESTSNLNGNYRNSTTSAETQYRRVQSGVAQKTAHRRVISESAPVITIIDPSPQRQGSVISRSATLRNRNSIKKRNKMIKKNDLKKADEFNGKSKPTSWRIRIRRYLFPIRRQSSLKYRAIRNQKPDYNTDVELARALSRTNAANVIKYLLPNEADFYRYHQLFRANPLRQCSRYKVVTGKSGYYEIAPKPAMQISAPLKDSFRKNGEPITVSNINLYNTVYSRYRQEVFNGNYQTVPQFQQIFPNDLSLLSTNEVNRANRTILLELLLRRTVAAKIEYRLKKFGIPQRSASSSSGDSSLTKPHDRVGTDTFKVSDAGPPPLTKDNGSDLNDDEDIESINTDVILQHNADLLSELLPSPQLTEASSFGLGVLKSGSGPSLLRPTVPSPHSYALASAENYQNLTEPQKLASRERQKAGFLDDAVARSGLYQLRPVPRSEATSSSSSSKSISHDQNSMLRFMSSSNLSNSSKKKSSVSTERRTLVDSASKKTPPLSLEMSDYAKSFETGDEAVVAVKSITDRPKSHSPLSSHALHSHELHISSSVEYRNHLMTHVVEEPSRVEIRSMKGSLMEASSTRWSGSQQSESPNRKPQLDVINSSELIRSYEI
ncbi:hypothetical protein DIURU_004570 [Diutina rugosa]|uniref:Uncharacterized protein n=1 Tax=Diutina rugosa TaxID=5481 RepID=A0A642UH05_DIURU|nr:uncharacterized protein DIURU_004570 [Diutina rugosa]KAA8898726.1 hypothetical protein DIURU_004570 [Diutina rugosa]